MKLLPLTLFAGALLASAAVHAVEPFSFDHTPGRLPKDVVPLHYRIELDPDLEHRSFGGKVRIEVEVRSQTDSITLNGADLELGAVTLAAPGAAAHKVDASYDGKEELITVHPGHPLKPGRYLLTLNYKGKINESPNGLYADTYPTAQGKRTLLGSQLESTDARRVFPSWDEPSFRATFQLSAVLPKEFKAYSNMPIRHRTVLADGRQRVEFRTTPRMASYLVAIAAGEFDRISTRSDGVEVGVIYTAGKAESARYPLQASAELLKYYDDYFGIKFPLPKLDNIATPGGFQGAMENWGAIIYNETALLYDPATSIEESKHWAFGVVAHEMAHQWFGDLVTTAWWDDLWLNEGFASWMATKSTDHFNPDWKVWLHASGEREAAMALDARGTTHPIQQVIRTETEAANAFDNITYLKGQSFLRMLEVYLGEDAFRSGLRAYMQQHKYANATTADLWAALEQSSGKPVAQLAHDWTETPGFPLVSVDARCEAGHTVVDLQQQRFRSDGAAAGDQSWQVPITLTAGSSRQNVLFGSRSQSVTLDGCATPLIADPEGVGYFRVAYAPALRTALAAHFDQLSAATRLKLLADSWGLFTADRLSLKDYLAVVSHLGAEPERAVWNEALGRLAALHRLVRGDPAAEAQIDQLVIQVAKPRLASLGWAPKAGESSEDAELRNDLISALGETDDAETLAWARKQFDALEADRASVPTSLRLAVLTTVGTHADEATYGRLKALADHALTTLDTMVYLGAMSAARDPALARRSLDFALADSSPVLVLTRMPQEIAGSGHLDLVWSQTLEHWDRMSGRISPFSRSGYFGSILGSAADATWADALLTEGGKRLPQDAKPELERDADRIRVNSRLRVRALKDLAG